MAASGGPSRRISASGGRVVVGLGEAVAVGVGLLVGGTAVGDAVAVVIKTVDVATETGGALLVFGNASCANSSRRRKSSGALARKIRWFCRKNLFTGSVPSCHILPQRVHYATLSRLRRLISEGKLPMSVGINYN